MMCASFNVEIAISIIALIVSVAAYWIARSAIKYQILVLIHDQMGEKARECNGFLINQKIEIEDTSHIINVLFSIVTTEQIVKEYIEQYRFWRLENEKRNIANLYYLQLRPEIREWLFRENRDKGLMPDSDGKKTMEEQFNTCKKFLQKSNEKYPLKPDNESSR